MLSKRLNGNFGIEIDCESVGVECHVGNPSQNSAVLYSGLIHQMQMVFSRPLEGSGELRNGHGSADNDERDIPFNEWNVGVVSIFSRRGAFMTQHWSGPVSDHEPQPPLRGPQQSEQSELRLAHILL
jgi:hypothetical protein